MNFFRTKETKTIESDRSHVHVFHTARISFVETLSIELSSDGLQKAPGLSHFLFRSFQHFLFLIFLILRILMKIHFSLRKLRSCVKSGIKSVDVGDRLASPEAEKKKKSIDYVTCSFLFSIKRTDSCASPNAFSKRSLILSISSVPRGDGGDEALDTFL